MKFFRYLLGISILISGIDVYACPRCRRAQPKGPRKLPHPSSRISKPTPVGENQDTVANVQKSCAGSCCCAKQKKFLLNSQENAENINEQ